MTQQEGSEKFELGWALAASREVHHVQSSSFAVMEEALVAARTRAQMGLRIEGTVELHSTLRSAAVHLLYQEAEDLATTCLQVSVELAQAVEVE